jgi:murein L,D-transpeptidase YcbB/YkuD
VVRLDLPNPFDAFLHGTPAPALFDRADRALSHGCIRVARIVDLARAVLGDTPLGEPGALEAALARGVTETVPVPRPVAVHVGYWTALGGEEGTVAFRPDRYGRDAALVQALRGAPASHGRPGAPGGCAA